MATFQNIQHYEPKHLDDVELMVIYNLLRDRQDFLGLIRELQNLGYTRSVADELAADSEYLTRSPFALRVKLDSIRKRQIEEIASNVKEHVEYAFANNNMSLTDRIRFSLQPGVVRILSQLFKLDKTDDLNILQEEYRGKYYTRRCPDLIEEIMLAGATKYGHWDRFYEAIDKGAKGYFGGMINAARRNDVEMLHALMELESGENRNSHHFDVEICGHGIYHFANSIRYESCFKIEDSRLDATGWNRPLAAAIECGAEDVIKFLLEAGGDPIMFIFAAVSGNLEQFKTGMEYISKMTESMSAPVHHLSIPLNSSSQSTSHIPIPESTSHPSSQFISDLFTFTPHLSIPLNSSSQSTSRIPIPIPRPSRHLPSFIPLNSPTTISVKEIAIFAATHGHVNIMTYILDELILSRPEQIRTIGLHYFMGMSIVAAKEGHIGILRLILGRVAILFELDDLDIRSDYWIYLMTILCHACHFRMCDVVEMIIDDDYISSEKLRDLMYDNFHKIVEIVKLAIIRNSYECFELLFNKFIRNSGDDFGLLTAALSLNNYSTGILFLLIEDKSNHYIENLIMCNASDRGEYDFVDFLISRGANEFNHVAMAAAGRSGDGEIVAKMLHLGADNFPDIVSRLVRSNFDVLQKLVNSGRIPLGCTQINIFSCPYVKYNNQAKAKRIQEALWLLAHGFQDCARAAVWAMRHNNLEILEMVLSSQCHSDTDYNSILQSASSRGYEEVVKFALSRGATHRYTAWKAARRHGHIEIMKIVE